MDALVIEELQVALQCGVLRDQAPREARSIALLLWPITAALVGLVLAFGSLLLPLIGVLLWLPWIGPGAYGLWRRLPVLKGIPRYPAGGVAVVAIIPVFLLAGDLLAAGVNGINRWSLMPRLPRNLLLRHVRPPQPRQ